MHPRHNILGNINTSLTITQYPNYTSSYSRKKQTYILNGFEDMIYRSLLVQPFNNCIQTAKYILYYNENDMLQPTGRIFSY